MAESERETGGPRRPWGHWGFPYLCGVTRFYNTARRSWFATGPASLQCHRQSTFQYSELLREVDELRVVFGHGAAALASSEPEAASAARRSLSVVIGIPIHSRKRGCSHVIIQPTHLEVLQPGLT